MLQLIVTVPLVLFGIWFASDSGGVQLTEVLLVFEAIVPVALPKVYVSVCVKLLDARVMFIVPAFPRVVAAMLHEDFLGIVYRATVLDVLTLKPFAPSPPILYPEILKEIVTDFVPSVLPVMLPLFHGGLE